MRSVLNEESFLGTIAKALTGKEKDKAKVDGVKYTGGSIAKYSKNLIMSFPLLCDAGIPVETAMLVSKANERNIVNMLQILFASMNIQALSGDAGGADIIAALYKDLDPNMGFNAIMDLLDQISGGNGSAASEAKYAHNIANEAAIRDLMEQFRSQKTFRKDSLNENSVSDFIVRNIAGKTVVTEEVKKSSSVYNYSKDQGDDKKAEADAYYKYVNTASNLRKEEEEKKQNEKRNIDNDAKTMKDNISNQVLTMQGVKKTNDLEPTLMIINYNTVTKDSSGNVTSLIDRKSFLAGVKSRMVPVDSIDLVERFVTKDKTKMSLKNLIRATTGEISFFKDFILCLDKIKIDAKNTAKKGALAQYWNILEKRSIKNNINKMKQKGNDASAITTICISADSVNYMKNAYRFDLENPANAKMIMDSYNLLGLIIADESNESAKIMYDGYTDFETVSYISLDRDFHDKQYKAMINMVNHVGR